MTVYIKENSLRARIAAWKLSEPRMAIVMRKTIYLYNVSREEFLQHPKWVRHEIAHVQQYKKYGTLYFLFLYWMEDFNKGYQHNRFEQEARKKEKDETILKEIEFA